jgi:hypothetical protein
MTKKTKPLPTMVVVKSSNIRRIGWDGDLYIEFLNGAIWKYAKVPREVYGDLMSDKSLGSFFGRNIKPHYKAACIPADKEKHGL